MNERVLMAQQWNDEIQAIGTGYRGRYCNAYTEPVTQQHSCARWRFHYGPHKCGCGIRFKRSEAKPGVMARICTAHPSFKY